MQQILLLQKVERTSRFCNTLLTARGGGNMGNKQSQLAMQHSCVTSCKKKCCPYYLASTDPLCFLDCLSLLWFRFAGFFSMWPLTASALGNDTLTGTLWYFHFFVVPLSKKKCLWVRFPSFHHKMKSKAADKTPQQCFLNELKATCKNSNAFVELKQQKAILKALQVTYALSSTVYNYWITCTSNIETAYLWQVPCF